MSAVSMPTRSLGESYFDVSVVGLGTNAFYHDDKTPLSAARKIIDAALDEGVTLIDTADSYGKSEEFIGDILKGRRNRVLISSKFGMDKHDGTTWDGPMGGRDYVMHSIDGSLARLQTDVIDLYYYHQPDGVTPILETLAAMHELVLAGKVRAIGCSNFTKEQLEEADRVARENGLTRFSVLESEYSLLVRGVEVELLPACERLGIAFIPYYPLASGLLTGKYRRGQPGPAGARLSDSSLIGTDDQFDLIDALRSYAEARGITMTQVAIQGLLKHSSVVSVIAGATKPEQVQSNAAAARWSPTDEDIVELNRILASAPIFHPQPAGMMWDSAAKIPA